MRPIRHPTTTATLAEPDGWDEAADGECLGLPITQSAGVMSSYWRPSLRERLAIAFGRPVRLGVFGDGHR